MNALENTMIDGMLHVRWMIRRDLTDMIKIEQKTIGPKWNEKTFLETLRGRNCIGMVVEDQKKIVGFMIYELHKTKLTILKLTGCPLAVNTMIEKLKSKLSSHRRTRIDVVIPLKNRAFLRLFLQQNFRTIANYDDYYEEYESEAIEMEFKLAQDNLVE